jgi:hypothetical protein
MTYNIQFHLQISLPDGLNPHAEAERIKAEISRESGYPVEVVTVVKDPIVPGIKLDFPNV